MKEVGCPAQAILCYTDDIVSDPTYTPPGNSACSAGACHCFASQYIIKHVELERLLRHGSRNLGFQSHLLLKYCVARELRLNLKNHNHSH